MLKLVIALALSSVSVLCYALDGFYLGGGVALNQTSSDNIYKTYYAPDGSGDAVGGVFAPGAIAHAMRGAINLESQRQAALRATDVVLTAASGAAVINGAFGVKLTADATI